MSSATPNLKLSIIGGGIAGLALAAALEKKHPHIDYHVYESVAGYKDVGAGLTLHRNAIAALASIGPEAQQAYFTRAASIGDDDEREMSTEVILAQGPAMGTLVAELGRTKGRKSIARSELLAALLELVPAERISFSKRTGMIEELSDSVQVHFTDGSRVTADFLIGADGIHSVARKYILGPDDPATEPKNHDGWQIYRTMVSMDEAKKWINPRWTTVVPILLGPRGHVNCVPLDKGTRLSAGVAVKGAKFAPDGAVPDLDPALYSDYSEDARQIVNLVARDTSGSWTAADHDHASTYYRGRVAMMGDAAHASMPFAGNGAAQALEDVAVLDHLFSALQSTDEIEALFHAYDAIRRPRSQEVVNMARKFGRVYAYAEEGLVNNPAEMKKFFAASAAFTNNFDVAKQNVDAMNMFLSKQDAMVKAAA